MARLPFRTALLFGSTAPANSCSVFGSEAAGSPQYSSPPDPTQIQQLSQWLAGWTSPTGAVIGTNQPCIEDEMAKDYAFSYFINYLQQIGIVEYDASGNTPYDKYSIVNGASTTGNFQIYMALQNGAQAFPLSNASYWAKLGNIITGKATAAAWVVFYGFGSGSLAIAASYNVQSVTKVGVGQYLVNFVNALAVDGSGAGIYTMVGSAGTPNGFSSASGDNNIINGGGPPGTTAVKTAMQCQVFCWDPNISGVGGLEDSNAISVVFHSP